MSRFENIPSVVTEPLPGRDSLSVYVKPESAEDEKQKRLALDDPFGNDRIVNPDIKSSILYGEEVKKPAIMSQEISNAVSLYPYKFRNMLEEAYNLSSSGFDIAKNKAHKNQDKLMEKNLNAYTNASEQEKPKILANARSNIAQNSFLNNARRYQNGENPLLMIRFARNLAVKHTYKDGRSATIPMKGCLKGSSLIIDTQKEGNDSTLHHEFFHFLDGLTDKKTQKEYDKWFVENFDYSSKYYGKVSDSTALPEGFPSSYAKSFWNEHQAVLFQVIMENQEAEYRVKLKEFPAALQKFNQSINKMKEMMRSFGFPEEFFKSQERKTIAARLEMLKHSIA